MKYGVCYGIIIILFLMCLRPEASGKLSGTLEKIDRSGVITVGYSESSIPVSYVDDRGQAVGYSRDLVMEVVEAIKMRLSRPDITTKLIPVTEQNRVALVRKGIVDIAACPAISNHDDRQNVEFSTVFFISGTRWLVNKRSEIERFPDLKGKNVVVTEGSPAQQWIQKINESEQMGMVIINSKNDDDAFATLQSGSASAFICDEVRLAYERAKAASPADWAIAGAAALKEAYSMVLPKGDAEFKELVDVAIARSEMFGKAQRLYARWFLSPLPVSGLNLNLPMSDDMRQLFQNPNGQVL
jgi:glutamate/aspartate transport system substrate-binding protein